MADPELNDHLKPGLAPLMKRHREAERKRHRSYVYTIGAILVILVSIQAYSIILIHGDDVREFYGNLTSFDHSDSDGFMTSGQAPFVKIALHSGYKSLDRFMNEDIIFLSYAVVEVLTIGLGVFLLAIFMGRNRLYRAGVYCALLFPLLTGGILAQWYMGRLHAWGLGIITYLLAALAINRKKREPVFLTGLVAGLAIGFQPISLAWLTPVLCAVFLLAADCFKGRRILFLLLAGGWLCGIGLVAATWLDRPHEIWTDFFKLLNSASNQEVLSESTPLLITALLVALLAVGVLIWFAIKVWRCWDLVTSHLPSLIVVFAVFSLPGIILFTCLAEDWRMGLMNTCMPILLAACMMTEDKALRGFPQYLLRGVLSITAIALLACSISILFAIGIAG